MSRKKVTLENLDSEISAILEEYADDVLTAQNQAAEHATKEGLRKVKSNSRSYGWKQYANDWRSKIYKGRLSTSGVLYNKRPGLVHLLEKGHLKADGKRTSSFPHALPVQEQIDKVFEKALKDNINDL